MMKKSKLLFVLVCWLCSLPLIAESPTSPMREYAAQLLEKSNRTKEVSYFIDTSLENPEAFSILRDAKSGRVTITGGGDAGILYGVQELLTEHSVVGAEGAPDFAIRGTVLLLIGGNWAYQSDLSPEVYPWFFDKAFMTRYLDFMLSARLNTLVLWSGHLFPHILELPEYPKASQFSREEIHRNQEQFRWVASECAKRNITVLTHFYNIHISEHLAKAMGRTGDLSQTETDPTRYTHPDDFVRGYYRTILKRYFEEFPNVGLYICPGESLAPEDQMAWFRDVIFKTAQESGKNPKLIIRDWTLDPAFKAALPSMYPNLYSERKHNDETISSPWPDVRHKEWAGVLGGHIVNLHDPADATPYRVGSPRLIGEMVNRWKESGYFKGAWFYPPQAWCFPTTLDVVGKKSEERRVKGENQTEAFFDIPALDRDPLWFLLEGRYLWKVKRDAAGEHAWAAAWMGRKFGDARVGALLVDWYDVTGPILPGLQNITAIRYGNFFPTATAWVQATVDDILSYRTRVDDPPIAGTTGMTHQRYYSQPVDAYTVELYQARFGKAELRDLRSMPVAQYAEQLATGHVEAGYLLPDKLMELYLQMVRDSLAKADAAVARGGNDVAELKRFAQDSRCLVMTVEYYQHKVLAALAKRMLEKTGDKKYADQLREHMSASVTKYAELIAYAKQYYRGATSMFSARSWDDALEKKVKLDYDTQMKWLAERK